MNNPNDENKPFQRRTRRLKASDVLDNSNTKNQGPDFGRARRLRASDVLGNTSSAKDTIGTTGATKVQTPQTPQTPSMDPGSIEQNPGMVREFLETNQTRAWIFAKSFGEGITNAGTFGLFNPDWVSSEIKTGGSDAAKGFNHPFANTYKVGKGLGYIAGQIGAMSGVSKVLQTGKIPILSKMYLWGSKMAGTSGKFLPRVFGQGVKEGTMGFTYSTTRETITGVKDAIKYNMNTDQIMAMAEQKSKNILADTGMWFVGGATTGGVAKAPWYGRAVAGGASAATTSVAVRTMYGMPLQKKDVMIDFAVASVFEGMSKIETDIGSTNPKEAAIKYANFLDDLEYQTKKDLDVKKIKEILGDTDDDMAKYALDLTKKIKAQELDESVPDNFMPLPDNLDDISKTKTDMQRKKAWNLRDEVYGAVKEANARLKELKEIDPKSVSKIDKVKTKALSKLVGHERFSKMKKAELQTAYQVIADATENIMGQRIKQVENIQGSGFRRALSKPFTPYEAMAWQMEVRWLLDPLFKAEEFAYKETSAIQDFFTFEKTRFLADDTTQSKIPFKKKRRREKTLLDLTKVLHDPDRYQDIYSSWTPVQKEVYHNLKKFQDIQLDRLNRVKEFLGEEPIQGIDNYLRRMYRKGYEPMGAIEEGDYVKFSLYSDDPIKFREKAKVSEQSIEKDRHYIAIDDAEIKQKMKKDNIEWKQAEEALEKEGFVHINRFVRDPFAVSLNMLSQVQDLVYYSEPAKILNRQIHKYPMPKSTQKFVVEAANAMFLDRKKIISNADELLNDMMKPIAKVYNKVARKFDVEGISEKTPWAQISQKGQNAINNAWLSYRIDYGVQNLFQRFLATSFAGFRDGLIKPLFAGRPAWHQEWFDTSTSWHRLTKGQSGFEAAKDVSAERKMAFKSISKSHNSNVKFSAEAAMYMAERMVRSKKWSGLEDPNRKNPSDPITEYEKKEIFRFTEQMINKTQYNYDRKGRAPIHRTSTGRFVYKFWSWPTNYFFNFLRESFAWMVKGETTFTNTKGQHIKVPNASRAAFARHIVLASALNGATRKLLGIDQSRMGITLQAAVDLSEGEGLQDTPSFSPTPMFRLLGNTHTLLWSDNSYEKAIAKNSLTGMLEDVGLGAFRVPTTMLGKVKRAYENEDWRYLIGHLHDGEDSW